MVRYLKADVSAVPSLCERENLTFVEAERELFGCDHSEVGSAMGRKWSFPEEVTHAIESHHAVPPPSPDGILDAVMLANLAAKSVGVGLGSAGLNLRIDYSGSRQRLGLSTEGFELVCARTALAVKKLRASEGMEVSRPLSA
jgi:HD-like signal output (HDOD) protein